MITRLIAKIMGWKVVWLIDNGGETNRRIAKLTPVGWRAERMGWNIDSIILLPGGKTAGRIYVSRWVEEYPIWGNTEIEPSPTVNRGT